MAVNSLYPGYLKLYYTVSTRTHIHVAPVNAEGPYTPGDDPVVLPLLAKGGGSVTFAEFVDDYVAVLRPFFDTAAAISYAEFWWYDAPESDPVYVTTYPVNLAGTGSGVVAYSMMTMTHRTVAGGILRTVLLDQMDAANLRDDAPFATGKAANLSAYLLSSTCPIIGRDGGYAVAGLRKMTKTNDRLRKRFLLDS